MNSILSDSQTHWSLYLYRQALLCSALILWNLWIFQSKHSGKAPPSAQAPNCCIGNQAQPFQPKWVKCVTREYFICSVPIAAITTDRQHLYQLLTISGSWGFSQHRLFRYTLKIALSVALVTTEELQSWEELCSQREEEKPLPSRLPDGGNEGDCRIRMVHQHTGQVLCVLSHDPSNLHLSTE